MSWRRIFLRHFKMQIQENINIAELTTFRTGGEASYFARVKNKEELEKAVSFAKKKNLPIFVLGEGSNVLINDKKFKALVIRLENKRFVVKEKSGGTEILSGAGRNWDNLVGETVKSNLQGIECLSGIPGTVGAAPYQNIGAYGQELKDAFVELTAFDLKENCFVNLNKKRCNFGYRDSLFKNPKYKNRYIIFEVVLKLYKNKKPTVLYESLKQLMEERDLKNPSLAEIRRTVLELRSQRLIDPQKTGNAGSFFKNPIVKTSTLKRIQREYPNVPGFPADKGKVKIFAGWLIEKAGWKGYKDKNVGVSKDNALVLVNLTGRAQAREISGLASKISDDVYKKFKVRLIPEVQFVNF